MHLDRVKFFYHTCAHPKIFSRRNLYKSALYSTSCISLMHMPRRKRLTERYLLIEINYVFICPLCNNMLGALFIALNVSSLRQCVRFRPHFRATNAYGTCCHWAQATKFDRIQRTGVTFKFGEVSCSRPAESV